MSAAAASQKIAEIITIGNEILDGRVVDTNRVYLAQKLKSLGYEVCYAQSVDDNVDRLIEAFEIAAKRSQFVFCTGGLGPTSDDLTVETFAKFLGVQNPVHPEAKKFVENFVLSRGRSMNESQLKQARVPEGCGWLENPVGTAPAVFFKGRYREKAVEFYFFPGIPRELYALLDKLFENNKPEGYRSYTWSTIFTFESELQEQLKGIERELQGSQLPFKMGYRTHFPENHISLLGAPTPTTQQDWEETIHKIGQLLGPVSYVAGENVPTHEEHILQLMQSTGARLMCVESSTGGLISHLLTEVSGSSSVLWGSQVCYANEEKIKLGVSPDTIKKYGAVSKECALEMAQAGLSRLKETASGASTLASLSITGIAGPGGGSAHKPVGLFFVGLSLKGAQSLNIAQEFRVPPHFERSRMKIYMAKKALELLRVNFLNFIEK